MATERNVLSAMTRLTFVAFAAAGTMACNLGTATGPVVHEQHAVERGAATSARVDIDMSGGELTVTSGAATLFDGDFTFNAPQLKPTIAYAVNGTSGELKVSQGSASGNVENTWIVNLDETTPIDLHVGLAAGDAELTLGKINLRGLTIRLGAGDLKVDLRGMPAQSFPVSVQAGAGDTTLRLPASAALSVSTAGLIGDVSTSGLEKQGDRWINPRAANAAVRIDLQVQHAIGDLRIEAQ